MNTKSPRPRMPHGVYKGLTVDKLPTRTILTILGREDMAKYRKLIFACAFEFEKRLMSGRFSTEILGIPTDRTAYFPELKDCLICTTNAKHRILKQTQSDCDTKIKTQ